MTWGLGDASHIITVDSGILVNLHKVREAAGEEPWQSRGRGGASPSPGTGRPHRQGQRSNDGKLTPSLPEVDGDPD